jgi:hypothetical protein
MSANEGGQTVTINFYFFVRVMLVLVTLAAFLPGKIVHNTDGKAGPGTKLAMGPWVGTDRRAVQDNPGCSMQHQE